MLSLNKPTSTVNLVRLHDKMAFSKPPYNAMC